VSSFGYADCILSSNPLQVAHIINSFQV